MEIARQIRNCWASSCSFNYLFPYKTANSDGQPANQPQVTATLHCGFRDFWYMRLHSSQAFDNLQHNTRLWRSVCILAHESIKCTQPWMKSSVTIWKRHFAFKLLIQLALSKASCVSTSDCVNRLVESTNMTIIQTYDTRELQSTSSQSGSVYMREPDWAYLSHAIGVIHSTFTSVDKCFLVLHFG